ncbi:EAL domain-containing protein [Maricaulis sp. CAU 1757]
MSATPASCSLCSKREGRAFATPIRMAFQPIVDIAAGSVFAHEALLRGPDGEGAGDVLATVDSFNRYSFDQKCRITAIRTASQIGIPTPITINFMPNAVYEPANCIRATLAAARRHDFPLTNIIFEFTETEAVTDSGKLKAIMQEYAQHGFRTAIDDFGAGHSGLNLLADLQPDFIKLDMHLTRGIDSDKRRQAIVRSMVTLCRELDIVVIAEGIETVAEMATLKHLGISLIQGYLFTKPLLEDYYPDSRILQAMAA